MWGSIEVIEGVQGVETDGGLDVNGMLGSWGDGEGLEGVAGVKMTKRCGGR